MNDYYDLSVKVFADAQDFNELIENKIFIYFFKWICPMFLDLEWTKILNDADDFFDSENKHFKIKNWKQYFPQYANNEIINEIMKEEILQLDCDNVQDVINSRLNVFKFGFMLTIPKYKDRINEPFFHALLVCAMIFDDANDVKEDFVTKTKTLFTMLPPDKAQKLAEKLLLNIREDILKGSGDTDFFAIDLVAKTLLMERNLEPLSAAEIFWLLAVYRIRCPGNEFIKIPFDLSKFLRCYNK